MDFGIVLFVVFVVATCINTGIQWYTLTESYPLQSYVSAPDYTRYFEEYERRLPIALYLPITFLFVSNFGLLFVQPEGVSVLAMLVALVANLSIMGVSFRLAVPLHRKHLQAGYVTKADIADLMRVHMLRLAATILSSGIAIVELSALISA